MREPTSGFAFPFGLFQNCDVNSQADFHAASPSEWHLACQREAVIRPLAETDRLSCLQVDRAAKVLGLVDDCKNKRYIIKFLDESNGGQDRT
jgi:hypothetical protein